MLGSDGYPRRSRSDRGANLVEFALLLPFLLLLILGMVEIGYKFGQFNEIRHGAREGARYAAVSNPAFGGTPNQDVVTSVCNAINLPATSISVSVVGPNVNQSPLQSQYATLTVTATVDTLTGAPLISSFVPSLLTNTATFRLEQDAAWTSPVNGSCSP